MSRDSGRSELSTSRRSFLSSLSGAGALAGCVADNGGDEGTRRTRTATTTDALSGNIRIAGSSTVYPLTVAVGNRFSSTNRGVDVSVTSTGTGGGFENYFCVGRTDFNDASRQITDEERELAAKHGVEPVEFRIATDAITVVRNDEFDDADCLTVDELARIWRADGAETWSDVRSDWPDEDIVLYGPTSESGTYDYFSDEVLRGEGHRTDYVGTEQDNRIVTGVSESKYAIGYFGYAYYAQNEDSVTAFAVDDGAGCVRPSLESAKSGTYSPLSRPLFIYAAKESLRKPECRAFCRYYLEEVTMNLVRQIGYLPITDAQSTANRRRFEETLAAL